MCPSELLEAPPLFACIHSLAQSVSYAAASPPSHKAAASPKTCSGAINGDTYSSPPSYYGTAGSSCCGDTLMQVWLLSSSSGNKPRAVPAMPASIMLQPSRTGCVIRPTNSKAAGKLLAIVEWLALDVAELDIKELRRPAPTSKVKPKTILSIGP
jgi:hypothetical protein